MKQVCFFVCLSLLISCETSIVSKKLSEVDSLVIKEEYDSAYLLVGSLNESTIKREEDKAHLQLVRVQTGYLVQKPVFSADSLLDEVISYYQKQKNNEKIADAYYYKAIGYCYNRDYKKAINYYKQAELLAEQSGNLIQQYKIAEGIAYVNRMSKKFDLQLKYAKQAYFLARKLNKQSWIAFSCYNVHYAYVYLENEDSANYYLSKIPQYINYVKDRDLPVLLTTIGYYLSDNHPEEAKKYLYESLSYQELTNTYAILADICYDEGKFEEYYQYLKKALVVNDATPKDIIIRNLIEYNLERGKTDSISDMVTQIFEIRDSIDAKLRNDTIKDLQTRFDHEIALKEKDQMITRWILVMAVALLIAIGLYLRRRYLAKIELQKYQMQIHDYMNQIEELGPSDTDALQKVEELNKLINDIMYNKSPRLSKGRMLYDDVMQNKKRSKWSKDEVEQFLEYYTATNYRTVQRLKRVPRVDKLTSHRLFFLILQEMGKTDFEIMNIMSIGKETIRTLRHRTKPLKQ